MSGSYKVGWNTQTRTVVGSLDPLGDRLAKANEFYEKMLLEGLKVFLAEVRFSGVHMLVNEPGPAARRTLGEWCVCITMPKGVLRLGWNPRKRKWVAELEFANPRRGKTFYSKSVEKMEDRVRAFYNALK